MEQYGYPGTYETIKNRIEIYSNSPNYNIYIAEKDNRIVGLITFIITEGFVYIYKVCRITGLIVNRDSRNSGIGSTLMNHMEMVCKSKNVQVIEVTSGIREERALSHKFYQKMGYSIGEIVGKLYFRKNLE
mgnify:FL=1